jgi:hypothetical protein
MSTVVIVNYHFYKIPASIDLEDKSVVKFWDVKWNKLCIYFVDGTEKEIESVGWIDEFDYKHPTGEPEIDYANNYGLEDDEYEEEEEEEEDPKTKPCSCGCDVIGGSCEKGLAIDNGEDDEEEEEVAANIH